MDLEWKLEGKSSNERYSFNLYESTQYLNSIRPNIGFYLEQKKYRITEANTTETIVRKFEIIIRKFLTKKFSIGLNEGENIS